MENESNTSEQGNLGNTENFNEPLTDFSNIDPALFQEIPDYMLIPPYVPPHQYNQDDQKNQALQQFWQQKTYEIQNTEAFKGQNQLPLARIKKIMKSDSDVKMISAESPVLLSKACEIFIQEMTIRAWMRTEEKKRRTIQRHDLAESIHENRLFDFLADVIPLVYRGGHPSHYQQPQEGHSGQAAAENAQVIQPDYVVAPIVDAAVMNMGINEQQAGTSVDHYTHQAFTMEPSIVPPLQFPYNFPPPN